MKYNESFLLDGFDEFIGSANHEHDFNNSNGKRYLVDSLEDNIMKLIRLDAEWKGIWHKYPCLFGARGLLINTKSNSYAYPRLTWIQHMSE